MIAIEYRSTPKYLISPDCSFKSVYFAEKVSALSTTTPTRCSRSQRMRCQRCPRTRKFRSVFNFNFLLNHLLLSLKKFKHILLAMSAESMTTWSPFLRSGSDRGFWPNTKGIENHSVAGHPINQLSHLFLLTLRYHCREKKKKTLSSELQNNKTNVNVHCTAGPPKPFSGGGYLTWPNQLAAVAV